MNRDDLERAQNLEHQISDCERFLGLVECGAIRIRFEEGGECRWILPEDLDGVVLPKIVDVLKRWLSGKEVDN